MGWHYTDAVDDVRRLKREGRTGEAEALLLRCVDATEAEARREGYAPAPWYYDQLAIIYRQQGDPAKEVAILERYVKTAGIEKARRSTRGSKILGRLEKARALLAARENEPLSFCPYCGVEITPLPKTSRACPICGEKVVLAKRVGEEQPSLLTIEQAEENTRIADVTRARRKARERAHKLGFDDHDMDEMSADLTAKRGQPPSPRDLAWALSIKAIFAAGQRPDWAAMSRAYQVQGDVLEEEGRSTIVVDQQANESLLRYYEGVCESQGLPSEVVISTRKTCCPECAKRSGQVVRIANAPASGALPNQACTAPRCRCSWRVDYRGLSQAHEE
jgi:predicted RNA-binding Zn-ribbon protein involved in translation (DUF1610 family)